MPIADEGDERGEGGADVDAAHDQLSFRSLMSSIPAAATKRRLSAG